MKKILISVFSVIAPLLLAAQVQLMDLSVKPLMSANSTDSIQLLIQFKMNPVSQAQSVQFSFGTQTGTSDVYSDVASVSQQGQSLTTYMDIKPNPAKDKVYIKYDGFDENEEVKIVLSDIAGRVYLIQSFVSGTANEIDVAEIEAGTYILSLVGSKEFLCSDKFVIQR